MTIIIWGLMAFLVTVSATTTLVMFFLCSGDTNRPQVQIDVLEATVELQEMMIQEQRDYLVALFHIKPILPVSPVKVFARTTWIDVWPN